MLCQIRCHDVGTGQTQVFAKNLLFKVLKVEHGVFSLIAYVTILENKPAKILSKN